MRNTDNLQSPERGTPSDSRESLGFSGSPADLFDFLWVSSGSLWRQSLVFVWFSGCPESAFLSPVSLASGFTVVRRVCSDSWIWKRVGVGLNMGMGTGIGVGNGYGYGYGCGDGCG